ncbi:MAG TPA: hypothetical protein VFZ02_00680 [Ktedonobacteraceae bacterium]
MIAFNKITQPSVGADYAHERIDPGIRMGDSAVMLSAAKHLAAQRHRPFASLRGTVEVPISSSVVFFETALSTLGGCSYMAY